MALLIEAGHISSFDDSIGAVLAFGAVCANEALERAAEEAHAHAHRHGYLDKDNSCEVEATIRKLKAEG